MTRDEEITLLTAKMIRLVYKAVYPRALITVVTTRTYADKDSPTPWTAKVLWRSARTPLADARGATEYDALLALLKHAESDTTPPKRPA